MNPREILKPFTGEMYQFILANSLRFLTESQKELLCFDLYSRLENPEEVDRRIREMKEKIEAIPFDPRFPLFQHLSRVHGITLLESDLDEVRTVMEKYPDEIQEVCDYFFETHGLGLIRAELEQIKDICREIDRLEKEDFEQKQNEK